MPSALDLWLTAAIGFLGSFGHCVGMCGPIAAAFALSASVGKITEKDSSERGLPGKEKQPNWTSQLTFHLLLNLGRLISYTLVGAAIGALGSALLAGGQMAGVGSGLRRSLSILMGLLLIWFGLTQASPGFLPVLPFLHPAKQQALHERINRAMAKVSRQPQSLTPLLLGLLWGLIPCGFLYTGQLRAVATQSWLGGASVMMAFGLGTLPAMVAMGLATSALSVDRRSQLFRLGGWITVIIGLLLLVRTGDTMSDYSGHAALVCLAAALMARPISRLWSAPLRYRRVLGVGAFVLSGLHVLHMFSHTWQWQWRAVQFMLPVHQLGVVLGLVAVLLMFPAAVTSCDRAQKGLGTRWRKLHLLSVPALLLAATHTILTGSHYWGSLTLSWQDHARTYSLAAAVVVVLATRSTQVWTILSFYNHYAPPKSNSLSSSPSNQPDCCLPPQSQPSSPDSST